MKTLLINIYRDITTSFPNTEVYNVNKDNILDGFYITLGMAIAEGVTVTKFKPLVESFASDKPDEFISFKSQWEKLKLVLLGENPMGIFDFQLSTEYLEWLKINDAKVYIQKYQGMHQASVKLDIEDLYEDTISRIRRKVLRYLQENGNNKFEDFVINDNQVNRRSKLVRAIKEQFEDIEFVMYEKWSESIKDTKSSQTNDEIIGKNGEASSDEDIFIIASDEKDNDEKWFSEFYTKVGKLIKGKYECIHNTPFYHNNGRYYHICDNKLKELDLNGCLGAIPFDEENANWKYLILKKGNDFFVINEMGTISIPIGNYDEIKYAYNDCVLARKNDLWGVVSLNNEIIIPFQYDDISAIGTSEHKYYSIYESESWKTGVIDEEGNVVIDTDYEEIDCLIGSDGSVWFKVCREEDDWLYGIVDINNEVIIPLEYEEVEILYDGWDRATPLSPFFKVKSGDELGLFNSNGEIIVPMDNYIDIDFTFDHNYIKASYKDEYDYLEKHFNNPPFIYEIPDKYCVYDKNGLRVCNEFPDAYVDGKRNYSLKNSKGRIIYSSYCDVLFLAGDPYSHNGECYVEEQKEYDYTKIIIIGTSGKVLGKFPKGFSLVDLTFVNGMALCYNTERDENCIINLNGRIIKKLQKNEKSYLSPFQNGKLFFLDNDGNIGYYDNSLSRTITCNNKAIEELTCILQDGILCVKTKNNNLALLHWNTGKLIEFEGIQRIDCLYGPRTSWHEAPPKIQDYFLLRKNDKYTLIDKVGQFVIFNEYTLMSGVK